MTVGEYLAVASGWEMRQRQMMPLAVIGVICFILAVTVWWPWSFGCVLIAPYARAWINRNIALAAVDDMFRR